MIYFVKEIFVGKYFKSLLLDIFNNTWCQKKIKTLIFVRGKTGWYFPILFLNSKIICISTSFKKEITILIHIAKNLQVFHILNQINDG